MNCENAKSIRQWLPAWGWYSRSKHPETITPFNNNFDWNFKFPFHKEGFSMLRIHNCGVNEPSPCKRKRRVGLEISLQWPTASQQSTQKDGFTLAFMKRIIESYCYGKLTLINADHF